MIHVASWSLPANTAGSLAISANSGQGTRTTLNAYSTPRRDGMVSLHNNKRGNNDILFCFADELLSFGSAFTGEVFLRNLAIDYLHSSLDKTHSKV